MLLKSPMTHLCEQLHCTDEEEKTLVEGHLICDWSDLLPASRKRCSRVKSSDDRSSAVQESSIETPNEGLTLRHARGNPTIVYCQWPCKAKEGRERKKPQAEHCSKEAHMKKEISSIPPPRSKDQSSDCGISCRAVLILSPNVCRVSSYLVFPSGVCLVINRNCCFSSRFLFDN